MEEGSSDCVQRAAEALIAANRCNDPEQAVRLRTEAYRLMSLLNPDKRPPQTAAGQGN